MARAVPANPRDVVNRAAREYVQGKLEGGDLDRALEVINNWRSAHSFPLNTFGVRLRAKTRELDSAGFVAQRIKRLNSIVHKIERFPGVSLSQMQDIGGCRAILSHNDVVTELLQDYTINSDLRHTLIRKDDYIAEPRSSGYRGIHLIWKYKSDRSEVYNDLKIEMQLRSQAQHAWATAVETTGAFIRQALKSSQGEEEWLRFFALMGTAIAIREHAQSVPGTPTTAEVLTKELRHSARKLDVVNRLNTFGLALQKMENTKGAAYYILLLDPGSNQVSILGFPRSRLAQAQARYLSVERSIADAPGLDAVLVSVDSVNTLQKAYPNYFLDTRAFARLVEEALKGIFS